MTAPASTTAQAAVLRTVGAPLQIETIEVGPPRDDEVLVRMVGVGVCHTDLACQHGFPVPLPVVLGHEGSGVVEAVGSQVKNVKVGDHVVMSFNSCGHCHACAHDHPANCSQFLAHNFGCARLDDGSSPLAQNGQPVSGVFFGQSSFATYAIAREINTVAVDKSLPLELLGPLGCGIQTGAGAVINSLALQAGESLAIFGGGPVGLAGLLGARAVNAGQVFVVEPNPARRALALQLGATQVFDPKDGSDIVAAIKEASGGGVNHALDTTALTPVVLQAMNVILPGGILGMVGIPAPEAAIPATLLDLLVKNVTLKPITEGDANPHTFVPHMLALYQQGKFPFDKLITTYPFSQINEAMNAAGKGEAVKPVLIF
ncbi:MAG TPA: NAD(P)-dependent alcohol dehydrogenase [Macromonas sp.]|nr:NAD(P)-dependent alcohol dehydrogenase [Macromonas sp.]